MNESLFFNGSLEGISPTDEANTSMTPEQLEFWDGALHDNRMLVQRILVPIVLIVGTLGNSITIAVMTRRNMQSSTNLYLTALAISDLLYLVFTFSLSLKHAPGMPDNKYWIYWHYYRYALWLTDASSSTSIWLTVTFTIERYIAVCHPIKGKVFCTQSRAKKVIIGVYLLCFFLTASTPHEWNVVPDPKSNGTQVKLENTDLGNNNIYINFFSWFSAMTFIIIPLILLAVFNTLLVLAVKRSQKQRTIMTSQCQPRDSHSKQETKITIMLIAVVLLAILCQLPTALMLIYNSISRPEEGTANFYIRIILNNYFNTLTAVNAAFNFVFYCALSDRYRRTFLQTFCRKWQQRQSPPPSWMATTGYTNFEDGSPRTSVRGGSVRHSRTSSYRSSISSTPKGTPSHTAMKVLERHHGNPYLTVPPRGMVTHPPDESDPMLEGGSPPNKFSCSSTGHPSTPSSYVLRHTFRNGSPKTSFQGNGGPTSFQEKYSVAEEEPDDLFDESLKISLDSVSTPSSTQSQKPVRKFGMNRAIEIFKPKTSYKTSSHLCDGQNIMITCQTPSMDHQTAV